MGRRVAMEEINKSGGVLGGRTLVLETRDDRSVPARAIDNVIEFSSMEDLVAVFGARFSPVYLELLPLVHEKRIPLMNPWGSADGITDHSYSPSYTFRLSLKDSYAMPFLFQHGLSRGLTRFGLLVPNTGWGRSNDQAAQAFADSQPQVQIVNTRWYNWGDDSLISLYMDILSAGAEAVILVANDREGAILVNELGPLPSEHHLPILSHWGVTGGNFFETSKKNLSLLDFSILQTFSFSRAPKNRVDSFMRIARELYGITTAEEIDAQVGVGHAYDLMHLLAMAIEKAGNTDRAAIRDALENLGPYDGLLDVFERPFTPERHDALSPRRLFMARYDHNGVLVPID
jgi:branched-chain amino acid transport system substrate-binding protein